MTNFKVNYSAKLKSITWPSWGSKKKAQLGQVIDFENVRAFSFLFLKLYWNPYFYSVFLKNCFWKKTNLAKLLTLKTPKLGQVIDSTADIYIYIYVCVCARRRVETMGRVLGYIGVK